jgi:hypothetical protein
MSDTNSPTKRQEPIIDVVIRGFDPLCEPGRTTTTRELAQGVLDALAESGLKIVAREPTEAMVDAARNTTKQGYTAWWRAMWGAAE